MVAALTEAAVEGEAVEAEEMTIKTHPVPPPILIR